MTDTIQKLEPIHLSFYDKTQREVRVVGPHEDRFVTTETRAAAACKLLADIDHFRRDFRDFLGHVSLWCDKNRDNVTSCFVSVDADGVSTFVVVKGSGYRYDLDDTLTALDLDIAETFPDIRGDVLQLPQEASEDLVSFFAPDDAIQVWPANPHTDEKPTTTEPS